MTDPREIRTLAARIEAQGGSVALRSDSDGYLDTVQITGARGIGPHAMGLVHAAEVMRAWLAANS